MSNSLAYGVGGGGIGRFNPEIKLDSIKDSALLKKSTYTDPLKRISWTKRGSKSRSNSVETPVEQPSATPTSPSMKTQRPKSNASAKSQSMTQPSNTLISYHSLDPSSPTSQLSAILSLSNTIFSASSSEPTKYSSLEVWQTRLSDPNSIIFFATIPSSTSHADVEAVGFLFAHPRKPADFPASITGGLSDAGVTQVMHIWLCGVLPQYRGSGVFGQMMGLAETNALEKGMRKMSVATIPQRFGDMYQILLKKGWEVIGKASEEKLVLMRDLDGNWPLKE